MTLLLRWAAAAAAVWAATRVVPGIEVRGGIGTFFAVALILGLVNAVVRPLLKAMSCGLIALTLGLFLLIINAALFLLSGVIARQLGYGFTVTGIRAAVLGSLVVSVVTWALSLLQPSRR